MAHISGSASIEIDAPPAQVWRVVQDVLSAPRWQVGLDAMTALEGCGMTESAATATLNPAAAPRFGTVGRAL